MAFDNLKLETTGTKQREAKLKALTNCKPILSFWSVNGEQCR